MAETKETKGKTTAETDNDSVINLQKRIAELEEQNAALTKKAASAAVETEEQKIDRMCSTLSAFINTAGNIRSGIDIKDVVKVCKPIVETLIAAKDANGGNRLPKHILAETIKAILGK